MTREEGGSAGTSAAQRLFVYGTLRRGGANDIARLVPEALFVATARMRGVLFDLGAYPALVADDSAGWVRGEIYLIPDFGWPVLDALEEVVTPERPHGEYFRVQAVVEVDDCGSETCEVYVANPAVMRLDRKVSCGDWLNHDAERS